MLSSMPWFVIWVIIKVMKSIMSRSMLLPFFLMVISVSPTLWVPYRLPISLIKSLIDSLPFRAYSPSRGISPSRSC